MKIAHLADIHLGFRQYHRQTSSGLNQREADVAAAFRNAVDGVIQARPDAVLVAGDLFHSVRPSNPAILFAFNQFHRLREALPEAPIVLIAGNHDTPRSAETGTILKLFESLGVDLALDTARRLVYPRLDLSVLAVPHGAFLSPDRPALRPEGREKHQVLMLHGEVEGTLPVERGTVEFGGAVIRLSEITAGAWTYAALGHYHIQHQVAPRAWYSGALEYVSSNVWGELREQATHGIPGKGWLLVDLQSGKVRAQQVAPARRVLDLAPIEGAGLSAAELDRHIVDRVAKVPGGIADQILRLVVRNVPRHIGRELNHSTIRSFKAEALHFQLDLRRPEASREVGVGAPGRRQTLPQLVESYLQRRPLPAEIDRGAFVTQGMELMDAVERDWAEG